MDVRGVLRTAFGGAATVLAMIVVSACAPPGPVAVPTFPPDPPAAAAAASAERQPIDDCDDVLPSEQLPGLLALPVDSVRVKTVMDRPAPSVGRLGRMRCVYSVVDPKASRTGTVLTVTVGTFRDAPAAHDQYERNVADLGADRSSRPELGGVAATAVELPTGTTLLTAYGPATVDLEVGRRPVPLEPEDLLVDLARRVWAVVDTSGTGPGTA